jgi:arylsulfatase A-like enzyme
MARETPPRTELPIPDRKLVRVKPPGANDPATQAAPFRRLRPPEGAPNVLLVVLDDVGFGATSAFGGPCRTPVADRLAAHGLRYTRFHTAGLCSPTRAALLTGRNHHAVGMGSMPELATAEPGYDSQRPNTCATLAEILKLNGYSTAMFGKCHEVPEIESSPIGPFHHWPTGSGFEHFYGFIGASTSQYCPALYDGTTPVQPPRTAEEGYHLTEDLADRAIAYTRQHEAISPDQPFFLYFAPGATHAPHHAPAAFIDRYKGRFDVGWDHLRAETFERQKALGVVPVDCRLTERSQGVPAWDDTELRLRLPLARQMEVYAAFLEHADHQVGRIIDALADLQALDDTLVIYLLGANGASGEGGLLGCVNETAAGEAPELMTTEFMLERIADLGTPRAFNHYAVGWAHAMSTPFQGKKQFASHFGGTRNGAIVHWPKGFASRGELRHQFHHVIDIAPTILEAAQLPEPKRVNGVPQDPLHGTSLAYSFDDAKAPERHETQYFEVLCNRGLYHKGWTAVARHSLSPWIVVDPNASPDTDEWELYDTTHDWAQARNLAASRPDELRQMQELFEREASRYNVFPLDARNAERTDPERAGRPAVVRGQTQVLYPGMRRIHENAVIATKNRSHAVTAEVEVPAGGGEGVIVAQGGSMGGWTLYARAGRLKYYYNFLGLQNYQVASASEVPSGKHQVRMEFSYDGGGRGKGGLVTLYIDGQAAGAGRVDRTHAQYFSTDDTLEVGCDMGDPVSPEYTQRGNAFNGRVNWVQIDVDAAARDDDHVLSAQERFRALMARQ